MVKTLAREAVTGLRILDYGTTFDDGWPNSRPIAIDWGNGPYTRLTRGQWNTLVAVIKGTP